MIQENTLPLHEKVSALLVVLMVLALTAVSLLGPSTTSLLDEPPHYVREPTVTVTVTGAVKNPGLYTIEKGVAIATILEKISPLDEANLSRINFEAKVTRNRKLHIPKKRK